MDDGWVGGWMDGWMDEWVDGYDKYDKYMDEYKLQCIYFLNKLAPTIKYK